MTNPPPMTDDLVGRLRAGSLYTDWGSFDDDGTDALLSEAAARIEALEGENRELSARLDDVQILLTPAGNEWSGTEPAWQSEAWHMIERTLSDQIDRAALAKDKSDG